MEEIILEAIERNVKTARLENEFVAGVLYGDSIVKATSVMFNRIALRKVLSVHGANAKVWIKYNESKKYGFIKEVQRHAVTRDISHIDVQIVSIDHEIKMAIPITYLGEEELKSRQLQLQVYKSSISVYGKMALMPETIVVNVEESILGDTVTLEKLGLDSKLEIEKVDEVYAIITYLKGPVGEVVAEDKK